MPESSWQNISIVKSKKEEQNVKFCSSFNFLAVETRLAVMILDGLLRFPAQRLFQSLGTPAARLLLTESPRVGILIIAQIVKFLYISCQAVNGTDMGGECGAGAAL
jgi:hypothetical protein